MPPRRSGRGAAAAAAAAVPAALPLDGDVIAISGTFDQKRADLESFLTNLGASIAKSVTKKTTHLITTEGDFNAVTTKVAAAQKNSIHIVSLEWAQECETNGSKVAEDDFVFGSQSKAQKKAHAAPAPAAAPATKNGPKAVAASSQSQASAPKAASKKRTKDAVTPSDNESDAPPEPKKKKAANGKAANSKAANSKAANSKAANSKTANGKTANGKTTKSKTAVNKQLTPDDDGEDDDEEEDVKKDVKKNAKKDVKKEDKDTDADGQATKSANLVIPLDEGCKVSGTVYIAPDGVIYDASLNQTNASNNNNKFYRIQLIQQNASSFKTWTRWGRVGEFGQSAVLGNGSLDDAIKAFDKKFKDKSGLNWANRENDPKPGKYAFIERSYEPDSDEEGSDDDAAVKTKKEEDSDGEEAAPVTCSLEKPVEELMSLIFNLGYFAEAMSSMNYDANKLPLGKLSKNTILRGFQALKDLSALLNDNTLADSKYSMTLAAATEHLSNLFYSLIPHAFGRTRPPIICNADMVKKEVDLLDSLSDMKIASDVMKVDRKAYDVHPADRQFQSLGMNEMTALDHKSKEFTLLSEYLNGTKGSTHNINYKVQQIFRIERNGELDRFEKMKPASLKSDRRLLWHGSRVTNFGGILSQGLRIAPPEAPATGYMFGKGIYLADMSTKSANYCVSYNSGGEALLLLCESELGDPIQKLNDSSYNAGDTAKAGGMLSTWGQGSVGPLKWKDASVVHPSLKGIQMPDTSVAPGDTNVPNAGLWYNEYIVYDVAQVRLRYLFRVKM